MTEIILHVGNENYVEGVVTEQKVKADTVTITKSFTETFNRDQNGTDILCEVSWMKGTSLQETKTSGTQLLLVYCECGKYFLIIMSKSTECYSITINTTGT